MITLRPFRPEDASETGVIREILDDGDPIIGITAEMDGRVVAYGGLRRVFSRSWAFFKIEDEVARQPFVIHRTVKSAIQAALHSGVSSIYTFADTSQPNAEVWLIRLGFRPLEDHERDENITAIEEATGLRAWVREG